MNSLKKMVSSRADKPIVRYFIMAACIVTLELLAFAFMNNTLGISYLIATPLSTVLAIVLNWYFSRTAVFKDQTSHKKHIEFVLVFLVSLVGIGIQLAVTVLAVQSFKVIPLLGKTSAIFITFFWNYWARKKFIFKGQTNYPDVP